MITRTTLKTVWLAGGGVIATWLAVSPNHAVPVATPVANAPQASPSRVADVEDLSSHAAALRSPERAAALRQPTRNPFRFNTPRTSVRSGRAIASTAAAAPPPSLSAAPSLTLSGVAEKKTPEGASRTAIITSEGQMYLAVVGDLIAGRYTVVTIEPEAVVLRDAGGSELRLAMRQ